MTIEQAENIAAVLKLRQDLLRCEDKIHRLYKDKDVQQLAEIALELCKQLRQEKEDYIHRIQIK